MQYVTNPVNLSSLCLCRIFFPPFHTIGATDLQTSPAPHFKTLWYIWSNFRSVKVWVPYNTLLQIQHFNTLFLKCKSNLLVKRVFFLVEWCSCHGKLGFNFTCTTCLICSQATQIVKMLDYTWSVLKVFGISITFTGIAVLPFVCVCFKF
jgi:hypothetical protein